AMAAFDPTNQSVPCIEPETDCITPRMKLWDDVFVSIDDKWMNEIYCQPPFVSHRKLFSKKAQNEWSIWEENRALWEENQNLWMENRMLYEENKTLQRLLSQNKAVQIVYTDATQKILQKENKPSSFLQEMSTDFQTRSGDKALQVVRGNNRVLEDFQQERKTVPIIREVKKAITVHEESKDASSDLQKDTDAITDVEEDNPGPTSQQEHGAKRKSTTTTQNKIQCAPSMQGNDEILKALQDLHKLLCIYLKANPVPGEKQDCYLLYDVNKRFQEEYSKLKLQLNAVKNTVSGITAQMEMLENELIVITSPVYEEAG
ncbi:SPERT protein, partial [Crotophaga sulcirostris]|nr:SPERT protein [Crotophaga sulcirostris]